MSRPPSSGPSRSSADAAAPVRVYVDRKGRRCGMVVGMSVAFAVAMFLWGGFMVVGLTIMTYQALLPSDEYSYYKRMPPWRIVTEWGWPILSLLTSVSLGLWLIAAARTYARFVRGAGECAELVRMFCSSRQDAAQPEREPSHGTDL